MIIADTGFFVALGNRRDRYHLQATQVIQRINEPLITTQPVITETCYVLTRNAGIDLQLLFLEEVAAGIAEIFQLDSQHFERIVSLIDQYRDLPMDFADASLVTLAEVLEEGRILTVDQRDFSIYRWHKTNSFENLLLNRS